MRTSVSGSKAVKSILRRPASAFPRNLRRLPLSVRHPRVVLAAFAIVAVAGGAWGWSVTTYLSNRPGDFYSHPSESLTAQHELKSARARSTLGAPNLDVIVRGSVTGPVTQVRRQMEADPRIVKVSPDFLTSRDNESTLLIAWLRSSLDEGEAATAVAAELEERPGVLVGGNARAKQQFSEMTSRDLWRSELIAFPLLVVLGLWVFRGAIAALLPVAVGSFVLPCALGCLRLISQFAPLSIFCLNIASALALGLAVDYSLLMVSRFRDELRLGRSKRKAVLVTLFTTGRTVAISSATIAGSFSCLLFLPVPFVRSIAVGGMVVALIAGAGALFMLPALFLILGERVNALPLWARIRTEENDGWYRLGQFVMKRPVKIAVATTCLLLIFSFPLLKMRFTAFDQTSLPPSAPQRVFSDRLLNNFAHPLVGEVEVAVHADRHSAAKVRKRIERIAYRGEAARPFPISFKLGPRLYEIRLTPENPLYSARTQALVERIRAMNAPIAVGGSTAGYIDLTAALRGHLLEALLVLVVISFSFLYFATRSLVLPIKAMVLNLLTLGAAIGIVVMVFQNGLLEGLLGYQSQHSLVIVLPIALGIGAFGLVTDYGLFLLMRIREARQRGASDREAVVVGLAKTGPVITAAALLFSVAVGAFSSSEILLVKEVAIGIVVAVALDAFVVRPLLVPSLMAILGDWNWWPHGISQPDCGERVHPQVMGERKL